MSTEQRGWRTRTAQGVRERSTTSKSKLSHTLQGNISKNVFDILGVYSALPNGWLILRHCTGADPYVIVSCEGSSVRSTVKADTLKPVFDTRAIFYRKKPTKPITVEVRYMGVKEHHYQWAGRTN
jgi:hypothetical protein